MKSERKVSSTGNEIIKHIRNTRKYTYHDMYRVINKISGVLEEVVDINYESTDNAERHEKLFKSYVLYITFIRYLKKVIDDVRQNIKPKRFVGDELFTRIEDVYKINKFNQKTPLSDILNRILLDASMELDYFNEIKKCMFPKNIQLNWNEIQLYLSQTLVQLNDNAYRTSDDNKLSFFELSKDIEKLLSIRDIDELLEIFMTIHQSNKNKFYITHSFKSQILKTLLSEHVKSKQNLVCLGMNPHISYLSYRDSFLANKKVTFDMDEENIEIYFEEQSDFYNNLYPLLLNLKSELPYINILEEEVLDTSKETLVLTISNMKDSNDSSVFDYYYNTLNYATKKAFMLVPYSMVSNHFLDNENEIYDKYKFMVKNKNIEKIFVFPNDYFTHTLEAQVLLEISKEPVEGIHFIDLDLIPKPLAQYHKNQLFKTEYLKLISQWYKHKNLIVDSSVNLPESLRLSKWVSYSDIIKIYNYNISPNYHLVELEEIGDSCPISDYFDTKKLQRFNSFKGVSNLNIFTISNFKEFGFTSSRDIHKIIKFQAPIPIGKIGEYEKLEENLNDMQKKQLKNYNKFKNSYQLQKYDILIYVNDPSIITIVDTTYTYTIASHNLIRLRVNEDERSEIEGLSKTLYLFLLSKIGQQSLQKVLIRGKVGRDVLPIDTLKKIKVDFQNLPNQVKKFDKLQKQQDKIDKIKTSMKSDIFNN